MQNTQDDKKYYWLKLHKDFFKRHEIRVIESMSNGKDYILFYLKLLVESVSHDGELRFSETIPYSEEMLAAVTNTNIDIVRSALKIFIELKMVEVLDDKTIFMSEVGKMIGSETAWAEKKRIYRDKQRTLSLECPDSVSTLSDKSIEIRDKSIEIRDKNINNTLSNDNVRPSQKDIQKAVELWNSLTDLGIKPISKLSTGTKRQQSLSARLREYGIEEYEKAINKIRNSDFLVGKNNNGWTIAFDWFVLPNNFPKVLEGNYDNKTQQTTGLGRWRGINK